MTDPLACLSEQIIGLAHVGFVVADLDSAVANQCALYGVNPAEVRYEGSADYCRFAFINVAAGVSFELIQPVEAAMRAQLTERVSGPAGINHLAWWVRDMQQALATLAAAGIRPGYVTPDGPVTLGPKQLVYLNPDHCGGALVELMAETDNA